jgi:type II secretory pathway pseudopilin PulG
MGQHIQRKAFSLIEALIALALMGLVLGVIVGGYQKVGQISLVSASYSERLELMAAIHRLQSELPSAITISLPAADQLDIVRVDPSLNRQATEARNRLPWPIPIPLPASDLPDPTSGLYLPNRQPFTISCRYRWVTGPAGVGKVNRVISPVGANPTLTSTSLALDQVRAIRYTRDASDVRLLNIEITPESRVIIELLLMLPMVKV